MKIKYIKVIPKEYAEQIRIQFFKDPCLWYKVILPKEKAEELMKQTHGDYSLVWHEHCEQCWKRIDCSTEEECFVSEDSLSWWCATCFKQINQN